MKKQRGERLFTKAQEIINGKRQDQYGNPGDAFKTIAILWNDYFQDTNLFDARDITFMMVLMKMAREMHKHKRDNLIDMTGYLGLLDDMETDNGT